MGNSYFGSKGAAGLAEAIIALMPPHSLYVETHLGSGVVMRRKPPALRSLGLDLDASALANFSCPYPVQVERKCAHEFLRENLERFDGSELVYCDPPYLHSTRRSDHRYAYDYEEEDHVELLELLLTAPCSVMVSGYPSELYDDVLEGWRSIRLQAMTRGGVATEVVWFNFEPKRYFWSSLAGSNRTQRQCIRRKSDTWARRYKAMGRAERLSVLSALMAVEVEDGD